METTRGNLRLKAAASLVETGVIYTSKELQKKVKARDFKARFEKVKKREYRFIEPPVHPDPSWPESSQALRFRLEREIKKFHYISYSPARKERGLKMALCREEKLWLKEISENIKILEKEIERLENSEEKLIYLMDQKRFAS